MWIRVRLYVMMSAVATRDSDGKPLAFGRSGIRPGRRISAWFAIHSLGGWWPARNGVRSGSRRNEAGGPDGRHRSGTGRRDTQAKPCPSACAVNQPGQSFSRSGRGTILARAIRGAGNTAAVAERVISTRPGSGTGEPIAGADRDTNTVPDVKPNTSARQRPARWRHRRRDRHGRGCCRTSNRNRRAGG